MTSQYATSRKWVLHVNGSPTRIDFLKNGKICDFCFLESSIQTSIFYKFLVRFLYGKPFYYLLRNVDILFIYKISYKVYKISNKIY